MKRLPVRSASFEDVLDAMVVEAIIREDARRAFGDGPGVEKTGIVRRALA